jgi:hypothetical protein
MLVGLQKADGGGDLNRTRHCGNRYRSGVMVRLSERRFPVTKSLHLSACLSALDSVK